MDAPLESWLSKVAMRWIALAYRHAFAEWTLWGLLLTGLPLWNFLDFSWPIQRVSLLVHGLAGMVLFLLFVVPFWISHRRLLKRSRKPLLVITGRCLEGLLVAIGVSGFWLLLIGNRGETSGQWIAGVHLYASLLLVPMLLRHAWRWSVVRTGWRL